MMRVVLDTNVLARAARGGTGPAAEVLNCVTTYPQVLVLAPFLLSELSRVLRCDRVQQMHGLNDDGIDAFVRNVQVGALLVVLPSTVSAVVTTDPKDDPVIATAVAGTAEILCTLDRHLYHPHVLAYCARYGIRVMSDVELLRELRRSDPSAKP